MKVEQAYDQWSATYDEVENKTRDLEAKAIRSTLENIPFTTAIELGCGTGKNTVWLSEKAKEVIATDVSAEMMNIARTKVKSNVSFVLTDLTKPWMLDAQADLITCSLILEHIEDLDHIFQQAALHLKTGGYFYAGELHPFKQYTGSKARFETSEGTQIVQCFIHNISDFTNAAMRNGFTCIRLDEWFDDDDRTNIPRIISFLFQKL